MWRASTFLTAPWRNTPPSSPTCARLPASTTAPWPSCKTSAATSSGWGIWPKPSSSMWATACPSSTKPLPTKPAAFPSRNPPFSATCVPATACSSPTAPYAWMCRTSPPTWKSKPESSSAATCPLTRASTCPTFQWICPSSPKATKSPCNSAWNRAWTGLRSLSSAPATTCATPAPTSTSSTAALR